MADVFTFTGADGKQYTLPRQIPLGALRASRKQESLDAAFTVLEWTAEHESVDMTELLAAIDGLDAKAGIRIVNAWLQGLSAPNFSSSSTSSGSIESPSPETFASGLASPLPTSAEASPTPSHSI